MKSWMSMNSSSSSQDQVTPSQGTVSSGPRILGDAPCAHVKTGKKMDTATTNVPHLKPTPL